MQSLVFYVQNVFNMKEEMLVHVIYNGFVRLVLNS